MTACLIHAHSHSDLSVESVVSIVLGWQWPPLEDSLAQVFQSGNHSDTSRYNLSSSKINNFYRVLPSLLSVARMESLGVHLHLNGPNTHASLVSSHEDRLPHVHALIDRQATVGNCL